MGTRAVEAVEGYVFRDHPHACGDKHLSFHFSFHLTGSSPRVWGQVDKEEYDRLQARIIPTRVGTRFSQPLIFGFITDHPHACGDKRGKITEKALQRGSSPRVWGQVAR